MTLRAIVPTGGGSTFTDLTVSGNSLLGDSSSDLIGFYGCAGTDQAAVITSVGTSAPVAACASFGLTSTQLSAIVTGLNAVIAALKEKGLVANS